MTDMLKELCSADSFAGIDDAAKVAEKYLSKYAKVSRHGGSVIAVTGRDETKKTVMLEAHIDQIGMAVTSVENGFAAVAPIGGIDVRMLPAMRVKIYGKRTLDGVFCSMPPHLKDSSDSVPDFDSLYIDTGLGKAADELISVGDRVAFDDGFRKLHGSRVTARSLDDRAGCAAVIRVSQLLHGKELPVNVVFLLSDKEEIGGMGAKTATFSIDPDIAVAVDVSFGDQPGIEKEKTGTLGEGAMLGISPILSHKVTAALKRSAENAGVSLQTEVMGGKTSTDADCIALSRSGVACGLLSIPLRNMHTPVEIVDTDDIEAAARIMADFVMTGCEL